MSPSSAHSKLWDLAQASQPLWNVGGGRICNRRESDQVIRWNPCLHPGPPRTSTSHAATSPDPVHCSFPPVFMSRYINVLNELSAENTMTVSVAAKLRNVERVEKDKPYCTQPPLKAKMYGNATLRSALCHAQAEPDQKLQKEECKMKYRYL